MQTQVITSFGDTSVFQLREVSRPKLKPGYVLIRVLATSVNPLDIKLRSGKIADIVADFPAVLHGDVAGILEDVAPDVTSFAIGDEVYGCAGGVKGEDGALAEYMLADQKLIARKPASLSMAEAAALPLVSITAWEALFEKIKLNQNKNILIHGGLGGVGHIAIQLAKWAGAEVYTTVSSSEKGKLAKSLGANAIINYHDESPMSYVKRLTNDQGFAVVFDTVGGKNIDHSISAVANYGEVVTIVANSTHDLSALYFKSATLHTVMMLLPLLHNKDRQRHGNILKQISNLVDQGKLKPLIYPEQFSFDEVANAHALVESGKIFGKVVITRHL